MLKKIISITCILVCTAVFFTGCGGNDSNSAQQGAPEKVVIGTQNLVNMETLALIKGYWDETMKGTEVEIKTFASGKDLNQAFASGEIDFTVLGASPIAVGLAAGIEYDVIYCTTHLVEGEALVANPDSGIKTVADLEGKKVATVFSSTTHYSLLSALKHEKVDESKVEILDMEPDKALAAYQRGDVDAVYVWNPVLGNIIKEGGEVVITSGEVGDIGYPVADFAVVRTEFAKAYPEYVEGYIEGIRMAEALYAEDEATALQTFADYFEMTTEEMKAMMIDKYVQGPEQVTDAYLGGTGSVELIKGISGFLADQGEIEKELETDFVKEHVDASYIEALLAK